MAGGKQSPRQKMINMMYLVLTALLALNISKEVLHAFVVVNIGLLQQKANIESKNASTIAEFQNQVTVNPKNDRIKGFHDEAIKVAQLSKAMNDMIEKMKIEMVMATDGVDETKAKERVENPFKVERKDDYDRTTHYFGTSNPPGDKGKANELKLALEKYKKDLLGFVKTKDAAKKKSVEQALHILDLEVPEDPEHKSGGETHSTWEMFYFYHQPQSAALVELTKWQNIVRGAESEILTYLWDQISATAFKFDAVTAAIIPKSSFVTSGSMFEADVFLAAYSTAVKPIIIYGTAVDSVTGNVAGGVELPKEKIVDGKGRLEIPASGAGERTVAGVIKIVNPVDQKETPYSFSTIYNVAPPSATVSATKMNVMYRGLDNPIEVSVPGVAPNNISVNCSGGSLSGGNGKYIVKPGTGKELTISVGAKTVDGKSTSMGAYKFRVKDVPDPQITWAGATSGERVSSSAAGGNPLIPKMKDFDFEVYSTISSYDIAFSLNGSYFSKTGQSGNTIGSDISSKIRTLPKGTKVYFDNVKVVKPGGSRSNLSAVFIIQ